MTHTIPHILAALLTAIGFSSCDTEPAVKVPSNGGAHAAPATFTQRKAAPPPADAGTVAAWVDGTEIMESAVQSELRRVRRQSFEHQRAEWSLAEKRGWRERIVRALVDQALLDAWVAEQNVDVTASDVDVALGKQIEARFGGVTAFEMHLADRGLTKEAYREDLRRDLALRAALLTDFAKDADKDVAELYQQVANRDGKLREVRLTTVTLPRDHDVPEPVETLEAVKVLASAANRKPNDLGWVSWSALDAAVRDKLEATESPKGVLVDVAAGRQLFWVHEVRERPTGHFKQVQPVLERRLEALRLARARDQKLRELRESASIRTGAHAEVDAP